MPNIGKYILKRLVLVFLSMIIVISFTWILSQFLPGDPARGYFPRIPPPTDYQLEQMYEQLGLNDPWYEQLYHYFRNLLQGDLGKSSAVAPGMDVSQYLRLVVPRTLELVLFPTIISSLISVKMGIYSAKKRNTLPDTLIRGISIALVSIPIFWLAINFQYFFGVVLKDKLGISIPVLGYKSTSFGDPPFVTGFRLIDCILANEQLLFWDTLKHYFLPFSLMILFGLGGLSRMTRSSMLDILQNDYIRTARAKGCSEKTVIEKHAFKNAAVPLVTFIGFSIGGSITGAAFIEQIFNFNGLGQGMLAALNNGDYWVLNGIVIVTAFVMLITSLVVDISYVLLDPRISFN